MTKNSDQGLTRGDILMSAIVQAAAPTVKLDDLAPTVELDDLVPKIDEANQTAIGDELNNPISSSPKPPSGGLAVTTIMGK